MVKLAEKYNLNIISSNDKKIVIKEDNTKKELEIKAIVEVKSIPYYGDDKVLYVKPNKEMYYFDGQSFLKVVSEKQKVELVSVNNVEDTEDNKTSINKTRNKK